MGRFDKLMLRLLGSQGDKIYSEFGDVIVRTTKELEKCHEPIRDLLISWLASFPWAYFEVLFFDNKKWNESLIAALYNAQVVKGEDCALITQAFSLWLLELQPEITDDTKQSIQQFIKSHITRGTTLLEKLDKFRKNLHNLPIDYWNEEYIYQVLNATYTDPEKASSLNNALKIDSKLRLGLSINLIEMLKAIKSTHK